MEIIEIVLISLGVAADAFAVAICKGLSLTHINIKKCIIVGMWFGFFQFFMPLIGFYFGISFKNFLSSIDHWVAFFLLLFIGINMIKNYDEEEKEDSSLSIKNMLFLAIATSIDALTIGIVYYYGYGVVRHMLTFISVGIITFILSSLGCFIGHYFENNLGKKSKIIGGIILIYLGFKILLSHLNIL